MTDDQKIRETLRTRLAAEFGGEGGAVIRAEMALSHSSVRVDLAVINGSLSGYEYKASRDDLSGLYGQVAAFSGVFDRVTIVTHPAQLERVRSIVPAWWGLSSVAVEGGSAAVQFETVREAAENPEHDDFAISQLLWRDEVLTILRGLSVPVGRGAQRTAVLHSMLVDALAPTELRRCVREALKARQGWATR